MNKKNEGLGAMIIFALMGIVLLLYEVLNKDFNFLTLASGLFFAGVGLFGVSACAKNNFGKIKSMELKLIDYDEEHLYFANGIGKRFIYFRKNDDKIDLALNKFYKLTTKGNLVISVGDMSNHSSTTAKESFWLTFYLGDKKHYIVMTPLLYFVEMMFIYRLIVELDITSITAVIAGLGLIINDLKHKIENKYQDNEINRKEDK